ncbi:MAG: ABC transporter ATP-binding protein [Actinomycetota bacterium]
MSETPEEGQEGDGEARAERTPFTADDYFRRPPRDLRRFPRLVAGALTLTWRAARRDFIISALLQFVSALALTGQLVVGRQVLGGILEVGQGASVAGLAPPLAMLALLTSVVAVARISQQSLQRLIAERTAYHAMSQVLKVSTTVDLVTYEEPAFHDRLVRALVNAQSRPAAMAAGMLGLISGGLSVVAIGVGLLLLQPEILGLALVAFIPGWYATRRASRAVYDFARAQTERDRRRTYLSDVLTGKASAKEIRAYRLRGYFLDTFSRLYDERIADLRRVTRRTLQWGMTGSLLSSLLTASTFAVLLWFVSTGRTPLEAAGAAAGGVVLLGQRLSTLSGSIGSLYESSLFVEDFVGFVAAEPVAPVGRDKAPDGFDHLVLEDVVFRYPSSDRPSVNGVSLEVRRGQVIALVGENGSGKTTLAKVMAGLYAPESGRVTWDGTDINRYDPDELRESVAVIFQDFLRYFLPARVNIEVGRADRIGDDDGVVGAARLAGIDEGLRRLRNGYDTLLGPQFYGGTDLSGGQWQRLALARGFFRDASLLILDEPTAALDPRAEAWLFESIRRLFEGRSVVLISHRFSSVRTADRIYVLHDGVIVEEGTHEQLMAEKGRYAELFALQASAYFDVEPPPGPPVPDPGTVPTDG